MTANLEESLAALSPGDPVVAQGAGPRGTSVTREGVLLAPPKPATAQVDGKRVKGWRLFVGPAGTPTSQRSTWVTLVPGTGSVERAEAPTRPTGWRNEEVRDLPGLRADGRSVRIFFGGKGGARSTEPAEPVVLADVYYTDDGKYAICDADSGETLLLRTGRGRIWWLLAPKSVVLASAPETAAEPEPAPTGGTRRGLLYEGVLGTRNGEDEPGEPVLDPAGRKVIGWLADNRSRFIPA
ncbi:hypothetical protein ACMA1D_18130 [Streptomyces sp. 796.1]|uniref:hypothetical protein n=1 Tax=Streptomyces sp. 796.1 TaxID=3163029 RepID=UPI0039C93EDB